MGGILSSDSESYETITIRSPEIVAQVAEYRNQNIRLQDNINKVTKEVNDSKIRRFEALKRSEAKAASALVELAVKTESTQLVGRNFGFFGITSTGKSTIINKLIGKDVAKVGAGETTMETQSYEGRNYRLHDMPGRNDELSYSNEKNISFWKGLTNRLIVVTASVKEMTKMISILDSMHLNYLIVVNKFENVDVDQRDNFKVKIRKEVEQLGLKGVKRIWFVSAKNPDQFPDWLDMVNYLTTIN